MASWEGCAHDGCGGGPRYQAQSIRRRPSSLCHGPQAAVVATAANLALSVTLVYGAHPGAGATDGGCAGG